MAFSNPQPEQIRQLLQTVQRIAVVGLSPNQARPSNRVARGMQKLGYQIIPVRPLIQTVVDEIAYPDLESLPQLPDLVNVFRAPQHVPDLVESCIKLGIKHLWLQDGVVHQAAAERATQAGILVVMNRCIWRDCKQYGINSL